MKTKTKTTQELACLTACDYAEFAAQRDGIAKSVYYEPMNGGIFRVLSAHETCEWLRIFTAPIETKQEAT